VLSLLCAAICQLPHPVLYCCQWHTPLHPEHSITGSTARLTAVIDWNTMHLLILVLIATAVAGLS
jgi:hypothetical protein